ncbi:MAG TPA: kelch repeat-containing protein [Bacteroidia bacterium]|nr:kelch repeat-containing protein [Bacteroidia bacterium]
MKKILTAFIFYFLFGECFSQAGEWVWIKGNNIPNQSGNYGVQGVPSATNNPPSLYEPCEWTDLNGNFWLFGGDNNNGDRYGDLWKYDPISNQWTWMKGPGVINDPGNYGIQGIPSPANNPPARKFALASWVDNTGNFWMFGGYSTNGLCDLWRYNPFANEWTWMNGPNTTGQPGVYGVQGIPDPNNYPGCRWESEAAWIDNSGDLWIFGGIALGVFYNDMWRYSINSNQWTWMQGSQFPTQPGTYGILGVEDSLNSPSSRQSYCHWKDITGKLWFFGGRDLNYAVKNDLWAYNVASSKWAWMGGDSLGNAIGVYGTKCISSPVNMPGARHENRAAWTDQYGNFWLFGGSLDASFFGVLNDLWMYCFATDQWIWKSGDSIVNAAGNWGMIGVSSPFNKPNARCGAVGWTDNNNNLYFFGGAASGFNFYNDLWKYTIDTACGLCPSITSIQENNPPKADDLLVFPNPTNSPLTISFSSSGKQNIELRIYNTLGKQIYFAKQEIAKGKFEKDINVEKLSEGIYFLQVKTKDGMMNKKVMVQH